MPRFTLDTQWYGWEGSEQALRQARRHCLTLCLLNAGISLACGMIATGVTRHNWVGFAATAALIALMMECIGSIRFLRARDAMDRRTFESIHQMMRWSAQCHILLMALAVLAGFVSCIQAFTGVLDIAVLAGFLLSLGCSLLFLKTYSAVRTYHMQAPD